MKNVEVPTGKKFLGKELTETQRKKSGNVVLPEKEYQKLIIGAQQNQQLKAQMEKYLTTDLAKENQKLERKVEKAVEFNSETVDDYNDLAQRFNKLIDDNDDLKKQVKTLKQEIGNIYQGLKAFVKENMVDLKGFKALFKSMTHDISQNAPRGEFSRLTRNDREINRTRDRSR